MLTAPVHTFQLTLQAPWDDGDCPEQLSVISDWLATKLDCTTPGNSCKDSPFLLAQRLPKEAQSDLLLVANT